MEKAKSDGKPVFLWAQHHAHARVDLPFPEVRRDDE
jgi:hypothetical protein